MCIKIFIFFLILFFFLSFYKKFEKFENKFFQENIIPSDIKSSVADHINALLEPIRQQFEKDPYAKKLMELVRSYRVTR